MCRWASRTPRAARNLCFGLTALTLLVSALTDWNSPAADQRNGAGGDGAGHTERYRLAETIAPETGAHTATLSAEAGRRVALVLWRDFFRYVQRLRFRPHRWRSIARRDGGTYSTVSGMPCAATSAALASEPVIRALP
jgi:hypothetical protein